jgi:serine/threonine-protein kinase
MAQPHADRNLLFGILALQLDFISRDQLIAALHAWVLDKHKPLGQVMIEQHAVEEDDCSALEMLVDKHLKLHDHQPQRSLAALSVARDLHQDLEHIADPELISSLAGVAATPPYDTLMSEAKIRTPRLDSEEDPVAVGEGTSSGLRFAVLRPHAEGGLGKVSLARDRELNRDVALKEIKPRYADDVEARARFLCEAEVTGGLEHPGVVPVYGLGRFADGRPFYAMRFVQGDSLLEALDRFHTTDWKNKPGERALALRGLLRRFVDVCNAVAYAHSRGVLHRDLKPANALLGPYGETLLVDWGLAKVLKPYEISPAPPEGVLRQTSGDGVATQAGAVIGTPAYMAPEQAGGGPVGPAADVYGLGATLYHLLTGRAPFGGAPALDILMRVVKGRYRPAREVHASVPAALSAICQKAMALWPQDRYGSAKELAVEVERWLGDEPVLAYREPWSARLARWARRHRPLVASAAALLLTAVLALVVGIVAVNREKKRTEGALAAESQALAKESQARKQTREALDEVSSQVIEDWLSRQQKLEPAQRAFLEKALAHYKTFAAEAGDSEEIRHSVADAHVRVGKIHEKLGQNAQAEQVYRRAQELYASVAADFTAVPQYRRQLAGSHSHLGILLTKTSHPKEAEAELRQALAIYQRLAAEFPSVVEYRNDLASCHNSLAILMQTTGRFPEAEAAYGEALKTRRALAADFPAVPQYRHDLAGILNNLGNLQAETGHPKEAEASATEALAIQKQLVADLPTVPLHREQLARCYNNLGVLLKDTERPKEAEAAYREALAVQQRLAAEFPTVPGYRWELAGSHFNLGSLIKDQGRLEEAERLFHEALAIQKRLVADFPAVPDYQCDLVNTLDGLAELARGRKEYAAARKLLEEARLPLQATLDASPRHPFYREVFCTHRQFLAATLLELGEYAAAAEAARDLARIAFNPAEDAYKAAGFFARCIPLAEQDKKLSGSRRQEVAKSYGDRAMEALRQALDKGYKDIAHLQKDKDLDPLRQREDFQKLLADVQDKSRDK